MPLPAQDLPRHQAQKAQCPWQLQELPKKHLAKRAAKPGHRSGPAHSMAAATERTVWLQECVRTCLVQPSVHLPLQLQQRDDSDPLEDAALRSWRARGWEPGRDSRRIHHSTSLCSPQEPRTRPGGCLPSSCVLLRCRRQRLRCNEGAPIGRSRRAAILQHPSTKARRALHRRHTDGRVLTHAGCDKTP